MAETSTLHDAFLEELRDMYHAEKQLTSALPKMAEAASSPSLVEAFESHLVETENHVARLEQVFESLGETASGKVCDGMKGIVDEAKSMMQESFDENTRDAMLIAAAQRAEHYEIAAYGTLVTWARRMQHDDAADLLQQNLEEESAADEKLTEIAESGINQTAASQAHM
jgi:ferritin-like metal-binding protein YciE